MACVTFLAGTFSIRGSLTGGSQELFLFCFCFVFAGEFVFDFACNASHDYFVFSSCYENCR